MIDYLRYHDIEGYLFEDVHHRFHVDGRIGAFDFFSIVVWKANRAKSRIARRLLANAPSHKDLDRVVRKLIASLARARDDRERMRLLWTEGFRLPMASAILTVLWPTTFTIYDVRVCNELERKVRGPFHTPVEKSDFEAVWTGYLAYLNAVQNAAPVALSLRDKDRYLWGRSVAKQLTNDIQTAFSAVEAA